MQWLVKKSIDVESVEQVSNLFISCFHPLVSDLFYDIHVLRHPRGNDDSAPPCSFDFLVHPLKWMTLDEFQGKVSVIQ